MATKYETQASKIAWDSTDQSPLDHKHLRDGLNISVRNLNVPRVCPRPDKHVPPFPAYLNSSGVRGAKICATRCVAV
jgi:hypothetical protein